MSMTTMSGGGTNGVSWMGPYAAGCSTLTIALPANRSVWKKASAASFLVYSSGQCK